MTSLARYAILATIQKPLPLAQWYGADSAEAGLGWVFGELDRRNRLTSLFRRADLQRGRGHAGEGGGGESSVVVG
jgi:hypothetical protein